METPLSSNSTMSLFSRRWPASDAASTCSWTRRAPSAMAPTTASRPSSEASPPQAESMNSRRLWRLAGLFMEGGLLDSRTVSTLATAPSECQATVQTGGAPISIFRPRTGEG